MQKRTLISINIPFRWLASSINSEQLHTQLRYLTVLQFPSSLPPRQAFAGFEYTSRTNLESCHLFNHVAEIRRFSVSSFLFSFVSDQLSFEKKEKLSGRLLMDEEFGRLHFVFQIFQSGVNWPNFICLWAAVNSSESVRHEVCDLKVSISVFVQGAPTYGAYKCCNSYWNENGFIFNLAFAGFCGFSYELSVVENYCEVKNWLLRTFVRFFEVTQKQALRVRRRTSFLVEGRSIVASFLIDSDCPSLSVRHKLGCSLVPDQSDLNIQLQSIVQFK